MILKILDRPIAFHRCLVDLTQNVAGALLLSQAIYWQNRCPSEDGWWFKTAEDWLDETGLHRKEFESARRSCASFLEHERRGIPAKCFYRVKEDEVQTRLSVLGNLVCPKWTNSDVQNGQSTVRTETSSETSSETTIPDRLGEVSFEEFVAAWNRIDGVQKVKVLSAGRRKAFNTRMKDHYFREHWREAFERIARSSFCTGRNERGWAASFDWFAKEDKCVHITEGKYDNRVSPPELKFKL